MILKKKNYKRIAFVLSVCALIIWSILGTGASVAWFADTSPVVKNIFHTAEFDLEVSHRLDDGTYELIDGETDVFDDKALYEPGYVQVVYLRVKNNGTVPFDYQTAVSVYECVPGTNVFGQTFMLQEYLKFGIVFANTEDNLEAKVATREMAVNIATEPLNNYSSSQMSLGARQEAYMALVVRMPEEVTNVANYRGNTVPKVKLGIIVSATQQ